MAGGVHGLVTCTQTAAITIGANANAGEAASHGHRNNRAPAHMPDVPMGSSRNRS